MVKGCHSDLAMAGILTKTQSPGKRQSKTLSNKLLFSGSPTKKVKVISPGSIFKRHNGEVNRQFQEIIKKRSLTMAHS